MFRQALGTAVSRSKNLSRREFLELAALAAAAGGTLSCSGTGVPWRFLDVHEARTLAAICDQIIPPDQDPGAEWAQVVNFIDLQLCGPYRKARKLYRDGLACVNQTSRAQFGKTFAELDNSQQIGILAGLEKGDAPTSIWKNVDPRQFFEIVLSHTMQGFYGDPRHGGNRAHMSWKMVGLTYTQVRGRLKDDYRET